MSKHIEKLKKQLSEISEVVNSFSSEAVQVRVVDRLLDAIIEQEKTEGDSSELFNKKGYKYKPDSEGSYENSRMSKKPGATKVLNQLLSTHFFDTSHSISSIAEYCKEKFDSNFKTSELSGILLKLANEGKLRRERSNENNRFEYVRL
jgi:hypothetical protein